MTSKESGMIVTTALVAVGMLPSPGAAQTAGAEAPSLEEIVVTAQKREEKLQNVPIAIAVMTSETLATKGLATFEGVARATPSIAVGAIASDPTTARIFMRGQGTVDNPNVVTSEGSVGIYQDGFFLARPQSTIFDAAEVERVEILRGPQGTLYGRNTTGGAVNIVSKAPSGELALRQSLDFGNFGYWRSLSSVDLPAWRGLAAKLTFGQSDFDGYIRNIGGANDFGARNNRNGRFQLRWNALDNVTVDYFFTLDRTRTTPPYSDTPDADGRVYVVDGAARTYVGGRRVDHSFARYELPLGETKFTGQGLTASWALADTLTIKSLTGYHTLDQDQSFEVYSMDRYLTTGYARQHQFSQELQLVGSLLDDEIELVGGLYYFEEDGAGGYTQQRTTNTQLYSNTARGESRAAYAQVTWIPEALDCRWELTLGARYTSDRRDAHGLGAIPTFALTLYDTTNRAEYDRFNPSATISYRWADDVTTYFKTVTGYRAGGVYNGGLGGDNSYEPENIVSSELGLKSELFDRRVRLNAAAFHNSLTDMQQGVRMTTDGRARVLNIGSATINGLEVELSLAPTSDLSLALSYAYLDASIDRFPVRAGSVYDPAVNSASPYVVGQDIRHQFTLPLAPKSSYSADADYTFLHAVGGTFSAHLDYRWQDDVFPLLAGQDVPNRNIARVSAYGLLNGRVSLELPLRGAGELNVSLWGRNLLDEEYLTTLGAYGSNAMFSGLNVPVGAAAAGFAATQIQYWGQPRTYGIGFDYRYR